MSPTEVCNMALGRFGARRISDFDTDTSVNAIQCRLQYAQTRRALIRSHWWGFAKTRVQLSQTTAPAFQWTYAYLLPSDWLRLIGIYESGADNPIEESTETWEREGNTIISDMSTVYLRYIRDVEDPNSWDSLFVEVMVLSLARKLVIPLSQDLKMKKDIDDDLIPLMSKVRAMDRTEQEHIGRDELKTWVDARNTNTA